MVIQPFNAYFGLGFYLRLQTPGQNVEFVWQRLPDMAMTQFVFYFLCWLLDYNTNLFPCCMLPWAEFIYLEATFTEDGIMFTKSDIRCNKTNQVILQLASLLQHKKLSIGAKKNLIKCSFIPTLCYKWTLNSNNGGKLVATKIVSVQEVQKLSQTANAMVCPSREYAM